MNARCPTEPLEWVVESWFTSATSEEARCHYQSNLINRSGSTAYFVPKENSWNRTTSAILPATGNCDFSRSSPAFVPLLDSDRFFPSLHYSSVPPSSTYNKSRETALIVAWDCRPVPRVIPSTHSLQLAQGTRSGSAARTRTTEAAKPPPAKEDHHANLGPGTPSNTSFFCRWPRDCFNETRGKASFSIELEF